MYIHPPESHCNLASTSPKTITASRLPFCSRQLHEEASVRLSFKFYANKTQPPSFRFAMESLYLPGATGQGRIHDTSDGGEQGKLQLPEGWLIAILSKARSRVLHREFRFQFSIRVARTMLLIVVPLSFHLNFSFFRYCFSSRRFPRFHFSFCTSQCACRFESRGAALATPLDQSTRVLAMKTSLFP